MFDGRLKVTICGAKDLQHTNLTVRTKSLKWWASLNLPFLKNISSKFRNSIQFNSELLFCFQERFDEWQLTKAKTKGESVTTLEPYVAIDVDEVAVERTSTKQKTKGRITRMGC